MSFDFFNDGLIVLDKPCGHTSHEITSWVKKITGASRTGHAGTLDPQVSGVLPVALGKSTKLLQFIAGKDKTYVGIAKFKKEISEEQVKDLFRQFTGKIKQTPPKKSAVRRVRRTREVFYLKFLEKKKNLVLFETKVSAGTYIRTLCVDMGKKIGVPARMEELRRISVGNIHEKQSHTMQDLIDAVWLHREKKDDALLKKIIHPVWDYINYPRVIVNSNAAESLGKGAQLMRPGVKEFPDIEKDKFVCLYSEDGKFIGVGKTKMNKEEFKKKKRGLAVKTERIHF